jgi:photosystem II stability/assembly factor-like uncharacterized protein
MKSLRALLRVFLLALALPVAAGINTFTPTGPDGGVTYDVEFTGGGALLATTYRAIYRSTDGGANWTRTRVVESWAPHHLAVNPANRDQVLFGSSTELLRSTDGGVTWTLLINPSPLQTKSVGVIEFSADGTVAWMALQNGGALYRTTDLGTNWTSLNTGLANPIFSITPDSTNPQLLYVQSADGSYISSDGGSTLTPLQFTRYASAFAASRTTANTALASSSDDYRIYVSTNGGASWAPTAWAPTPGRIVKLMQYVPGAAGKAIAMDDQFRLLRTLDDGQHWTELGPAPNGQINSITFHPADPTRIFMATYGGLFESTDDGATWAERNRGLREGNLSRVVVSRAGAGATYLKSWDLASVYLRVADTGAWNPVGRASVPLLGRPASLSTSNGYSAFGVSPQNPQLLYLSREQKFGVSNDGGVTWGLRSAVPDMNSIEISPANDQVILMGARAQPPIRSVDGGASWESLGSHGLPAGVVSFAFDPTNAALVYAAVDNYFPPATTAMYKSVDGGANFAPAPWNATHNPSVVWRLVHDPSRANIVYLSAYHGLYKTTNGGATWTHQPLFNDTVTSGGAIDLIVDPQSPEILYASAFQRGWIARSVNGGASWDVLRESDAFDQFDSIALVPGTRNKLVAIRRSASREIDFAARLALGVSTPLVTVNTPATSVFTLANQGTFAVSAVRLTATLPASSTTHSIQSSSGTCARAELALACDFGIMPANSQTTVTVGYTPTSAGTWSATAAAYEPDDNAVDNSAQVAIGAPPPPARGGGGGGGGRLDYLLLLMLGTLALRGSVRRR